MGNYVTIADIRSEGVDAAEYSDALITRRIAKWEGIAETLTRNIFRVIEPGELTFDGNNTHRLSFNLALVEVSALKVNGDSAALDADQYRAYTGKQKPQDDRGNPKIELVGANIPSGQSVPSPWSSGASLFKKGLDQKVTAKWGHVDPDPDSPGDFITPPAVKESIIALVVGDLRGYLTKYLEGVVTPAGPATRERTDDHEVQWSHVQTAVTWSMLPNEVRDTLLMYRAPMAVDIVEVRDLTAFDVTFVGAR